MTRIAILNSKGGCGKTTISINLAIHFADILNEPTTLVDTDDQSSTGVLLNIRGEEGLKTNLNYETDYDLETITDTINEASKTSNYIIIEGGAKATSLMVPALQAADIVIIPFLPTVIDFLGVKDTVEIIKTYKELHNPKLPVYFLLMKASKTKNGSRERRKDIVSYGFPIMKNETTDKVAFEKPLEHGITVCDKPQFTAEHAEIKAIAREIATITKRVKKVTK